MKVEGVEKEEKMEIISVEDGEDMVKGYILGMKIKKEEIRVIKEK